MNESTNLQPLFDQLSDLALVRLPEAKKLFGVSAPTVWRRVKSGHIPAPVKVGLRTTCWQVGKLRAHLAGVGK